AVPRGRGAAGGARRPRHRGRAGHADRARRAAPARLRPRRTRRGAGDVRPAGEAARRVARGSTRLIPLSAATILVTAGGLVVLAGLFAMSDAAVSSVSV